LEKFEMKKTLVALAALATVGAAFAQSSVTLYGKIDWEIVSKSSHAAGVANLNPGLQVNSAGLSGSRWGMKGSEDLGGGLNAIFDLQGGFSVDSGQMGQCGGANVINLAACNNNASLTGINAPRIFGRSAYAGSKGNFGQLTVGRQYAPYDNAFGNVDAQGYSSNSAMGNVWNGNAVPGQAAPAHADAGPGGPGRVDNQITYYTPAMGGFNAQVSYAPGENKTLVSRASEYAGLGLGYGNGPLNIQYAYESLRGMTGVPTSTGYILGASYNFGPASLYGAYGQGNASGVSKDKKYAIGVTAPVGPVVLSLGYAKNRNTLAGAGNSSDTHGVGGQAVYSLSKRTNVYAEFMANTGTNAGAASSAKANQFGVGMRHDF
jgi:predicted porin